MFFRRSEAVASTRLKLLFTSLTGTFLSARRLGNSSLLPWRLVPATLWARRIHPCRSALALHPHWAGVSNSLARNCGCLLPSVPRQVLLPRSTRRSRLFFSLSRKSLAAGAPESWALLCCQRSRVSWLCVGFSAHSRCSEFPRQRPLARPNFLLTRFWAWWAALRPSFLRKRLAIS